MKKIILALLMSIFIDNCLAQPISVDFSGIPLFWRTVDILKTDRLPTQAEWDTLFLHPAYKQIQANGNRCTLLKKYMPMVYMPSRNEQLQKILSGDDDFIKSLCNHLSRINEERKAITESRINFKELAAKALKASLDYLPTSIKKEQFPTIYVILFEPNGFGNPEVVLDLLFMYHSDEISNFGLIAHEAHHALRGKVAQYKRLNTTAPYTSIYNGITGLELEGIPSMLDKKDWIYKDSIQMNTEQKEFINAYRSSPVIFKTLDSLFSLVQKKKIASDKVGDIKSMLFWGGHANGMYMAMAIEKVLGRSYLGSLVGRPIDFFLAYQQAAKKSKEYYLFSQETETLLNEIKEKYF